MNGPYNMKKFRARLPQPKGCPSVTDMGRVCAVRDTCLRYQYRGGLLDHLKANLCLGYGKQFLVSADSVEATEFLRQVATAKKEHNPFVLKRDWNGIMPTTEAMYECVACCAAKVMHSIKVVKGPVSMPYVNRIPMYVAPPGTVRTCTGCGRWDGPWLPYSENSDELVRDCEGE